VIEGLNGYKKNVLAILVKDLLDSIADKIELPPSISVDPLEICG